MLSFFKRASFVGVLAIIPSAIADFDAASQSNIAAYWGQNSYGQGTGDLMQQRLSYYCANEEIDIIPLAFLYSIIQPRIDFANQGADCTAIAGSSLFYCSELEQDIATCQETYGKTILLSIGGATYDEGGFTSEDAAITAANNVWSWFGPDSAGGVRPFGSAVIDGFDMDFESRNTNMPAFANQLRSLMDADTSKTWLLSAAPQCPFPDAAVGDMLAGAVSFDIVWVQFYNNYCGVQGYIPDASNQDSFNFDTWDSWAKTSSRNPNVKIMLGIPGNKDASGSGYVSEDALADVISYSKTFSSFGGVMVWDITQLYANTGYLDAISENIGEPRASVPVSTSTSTSTVPTTDPPTTLTTTTPPTTTNTPASSSSSSDSSDPASSSSSPASSNSSTPSPTTISPGSTLITITTPLTTNLDLTTTIPTSSSTAPAPVPTPNNGSGGGLVHPWNQCGGQGWTGGTVCIGGTTCVVYSVWYSQCKP
ncbi:hypothetical protein DSL72_004290 [Monilinia vaccinii-corymbosi]|uniref:chitinase n=1 Tax=Monilinia vaccinii-corymbosi TaxID=61207 RepID=A0A8A3NW87_9HELO|nr:hypothetical protein DSL72_004290 [Monilinia vaccinii-corymbosi]